MTKAIRFYETGSPDVLRWEDFDPGMPGPGEIRMRTSAVGLNFIDTYQRSGLYPVPLPSGLGMEGAGTIVALGEGVTGLHVGQRIAYPSSPLGAYAEERLLPAKSAVPLPDHIDDRMAAAIMLKGMTAEALLRRVFRVKAGDTILWHAAAGGVGLIACQWARHLGFNVIGTVGSDDKMAALTTSITAARISSRACATSRMEKALRSFMIPSARQHGRNRWIAFSRSGRWLVSAMRPGRFRRLMLCC
jgi:NADPH2:quinone reductase